MAPPKKSGKCAICKKVPGPHNFALPPKNDSACHSHDVGVCKACWEKYLEVEIEDYEDTEVDIKCVKCKETLTFEDIELRASKESFTKYMLIKAERLVEDKKLVESFEIIDEL